ncbi:histone-lysine N-methyltransferase SETMAR [Trichonephila clavipes]|nr:histone-lysine N-methyltransferase SETMAR [Trichonephila clavipes]
MKSERLIWQHWRNKTLHMRSGWYRPSALTVVRSNIVKQFLAKKGVVEIEHPPFSPDLNLPDFFPFPRLKLALKGKRFDDISDIQRNVTRLLSSIPKEDFLQSFQDMHSRPQLCIAMGSDYF